MQKDAGTVDLPQPLRIRLEQHSLSALDPLTNSETFTLSYNHVRFRDGMFETAVPGVRAGVKSRPARAAYVICTRVTHGTLARMIGRQIFDRVLQFFEIRR